MHAALDDKDMYFEGVVRCCSEEVLNDDVPADGWGLTKSIVEKKEIIAVFGVGTDGKGLVEFRGVCATTGKRARASTALMLPTQFDASTSSFVWFKAEDGRVRRGRIAGFCVYLPPTSGKPLMPECGGQVVLFAHVFNAVDVEWHVVVCIPIKPTPFCPNSPCSVCCTAQTLYTSIGNPVNGMPMAVIVDRVRLEKVKELYQDSLTEDLAKKDMQWWTNCKHCNEVRYMFDFTGALDAEAEMNKVEQAIESTWDRLMVIFRAIPENDVGFVQPMQTSLNLDDLKKILSFKPRENGDDADLLGMDWPWDHKDAVGQEDTEPLAFLLYDRAPDVPAAVNQTSNKAEKPNKVARTARSEADVLQLEDPNEFLLAFIHCNKADPQDIDRVAVARVQISRLVSEKMYENFDNIKTKMWTRFLSVAVTTLNKDMPGWWRLLSAAMERDMLVLGAEMVKKKVWTDAQLQKFTKMIKDQLNKEPNKDQPNKEPNKKDGESKKKVDKPEARGPKGASTKPLKAAPKSSNKTIVLDEDDVPGAAMKPIMENLNKSLEAFDSAVTTGAATVNDVKERVGKIQTIVANVEQIVSEKNNAVQPQSNPEDVSKIEQLEARTKALEAEKKQVEMKLEVAGCAIAILASAVPPTKDDLLKAARTTLSMNKTQYSDNEVNKLIPLKDVAPAPAPAPGPEVAPA